MGPSFNFHFPDHSFRGHCVHPTYGGLLRLLENPHLLCFLNGEGSLLPPRTSESRRRLACGASALFCVLELGHHPLSSLLVTPLVKYLLDLRRLIVAQRRTEDLAAVTRKLLDGPLRVCGDERENGRVSGLDGLTHVSHELVGDPEILLPPLGVDGAGCGAESPATEDPRSDRTGCGGCAHAAGEGDMIEPQGAGRKGFFDTINKPISKLFSK